MSNRAADRSCDLARIPSHVGLPHPDNEPSDPSQATPRPYVTCAIRSDLWDPVGGVGPALELRLEALPVAAMPEVPVTKQSNASRRKDHVWLPREMACMFPVSQPETPERSTKNKLWRRVDGPIGLLRTGARRRGWSKGCEARASHGGLA
jgi:hypothetical protein